MFCVIPALVSDAFFRRFESVEFGQAVHCHLQPQGLQFTHFVHRIELVLDLPLENINFAHGGI